MAIKKTLRYYFWLIQEFIKKQLRTIVLSFFFSFILIIGLITFAPFIHSTFLSQKEVIGIVGTFDYSTLPDKISKKISNGLLFVNEKGEFVPAVASNWEVVKEGLVYRFNIRDGLIWSNGDPFSAYDIDYNFKNVKTTVIDEKTISFTLENRLPIFPNYLTKPLVKFPLVGIAGLYKTERIKSRYGQILELSLSPNKKGLPIVVYKFYKTESDLVNAYKQGEINQMDLSKKSIADVFARWNNSKVTKSLDYSKLFTLYLNLSTDFLRDKDIRDAISMAINQTNFSNFGELALGPIPPSSWAYNPNLKNPIFDQEAAAKILKKSQSASEEAKLNLFTFYDYLSQAELIVQDLKSAGLNINLKLVSGQKPSDFDLFLALWNVPEDPDQYFFWHSTQNQGNLSSYKNVKIDKLLEDARSTSIIDERIKLYHEFQKVIIDETPAVFLYYPFVYTIKRK